MEIVNIYSDDGNVDDKDGNGGFVLHNTVAMVKKKIRMREIERQSLSLFNMNNFSFGHFYLFFFFYPLC